MSGLIVPFKGFVPRVDGSAFVAPNAALAGDVEIAARYGELARSDRGSHAEAAE